MILLDTNICIYIINAKLCATGKRWKCFWPRWHFCRSMPQPATCPKHEAARVLIQLTATAGSVLGQRPEVEPGFTVHAHLPHGVVQQLRHAGDVVVGTVGGTFFAKEQFLVGHAAQQHAHVVFNVALGFKQVDTLLVKDEAQGVGARIGLE